MTEANDVVAAPHDTGSEPLLLVEVTLERFKAAFKPGPISLRPFNVVIGRNGSGKSTLLEALQWLDGTIRRDAREASDRYAGVGDLINLRSQDPYFKLVLKWTEDGERPLWRYTLRVDSEEGVPRVSDEELALLDARGRRSRQYVVTEDGMRWVQPDGDRSAPGRFPVPERDRVAIVRAAESPHSMESPRALEPFWRRAVFLRLSSNRLAFGSPATRKSFEPLLDEEGQTLPALLNELNAEQRAELIENVQAVLPRVGGVDVSKAEGGRDTRVHYSLLERSRWRPYALRSSWRAADRRRRRVGRRRWSGSGTSMLRTSSA